MNPDPLFARCPHPDQFRAAWDILTDNYGMVVRKWRSAWPLFAAVLTRPEVLSASIDAATRGVMNWRPGRGTQLKTYVLNAVRWAALRARERHERDRRRCRVVDPEILERRAG